MKNYHIWSNRKIWLRWCWIDWYYNKRTWFFGYYTEKTRNYEFKRFTFFGLELYWNIT